MDKPPKLQEKIKVPATIKELEIFIKEKTKEVEELRRKKDKSLGGKSTLDKLMGLRKHAEDKLAELTLKKLL